MVDIKPADEVLAEKGDRFQTVMAILIALVTIVGAVVAWRTAILSERAGNADFASTNAVINTQETLTVGTAQLFQRYRAYTDYLLNKQLVALLEVQLETATPEEAEIINAQLIEARDLVLNNEDFFVTRFLDMEGNYDTNRDLGETVATAKRTKDLDPLPHIAEADQSRVKVQQMVSVFVVLAVALLFYTLAEAFNPERTILRYSAAAIATVCLIFSIVATLLIEMR